MYYFLLNMWAWAFVTVCLFGLVWFFIATPFVLAMPLFMNTNSKPAPVKRTTKQDEIAIKQRIKENQYKMDEVQRKFRLKMSDNPNPWGI